MKCSVIIPTYFRSVDLKNLLISLEKQITKPFEVIIVDDTPTKEVKEISIEFQNRLNLNYIKNPNMRSASVARNLGAEKSKGEVIMFLDSDVILKPDYIEKILVVFNDYKDAIGVQGWIENVIDCRGWRQLYSRLIGTLYHTQNKCDLWQYPVVLNQIIPSQWLSSSNMSIKRNIFDNGFRFDENLQGYSFMEDVLLSYSIYNHYNKSGLYITPYAKVIHKKWIRDGGYFNSKHIAKCRKYVFWKLFGWRGILRDYRVNLGYKLLKFFKKYKILR